MKKVKASSILNEAVQIKNFVEKNHKLPKTCTLNDGQVFDIYNMSFMMASLLLNTRVELWKFDVDVKGYTISKYKDKLNNVKVINSRYMDMVSRFVAYTTKNGRVPSNIMVNGELGSASFELFTFCLAKIVAFYHNKASLPAYCMFNKADIEANGKTVSNTKKTTTSSTSNKQKTVKKNNCENPYTSTPHLLTTKDDLGQKYPYSCACNSLQQALYKLTQKKISEKTLCTWAGTTTKGTSEDGIKTAIAKFNKTYNTKLQVEFKYFSEMGKTDLERYTALGKILCQKNKAVITHIGYQDSGEKINDKATFGHWEVLDKIDIKNKTVRALNSLGYKNKDGSYQGHLQTRTWKVQSHYFAKTTGGQKALCIITKK